MYTHAHIYIGCFTDSPPSYTYIYKHIYALFHHTEWSICFTAQIAHHHVYIYIHIYSVSPHRVNISFTSQMAQFYHTGEANNLDGDLFITTLYTHMYTHTHKYTICFTDNPPSYTHTHIYIYIYYVSPHRVKYLFYRTDSPPSCICIHICSVSPHRVNICFTAQMAQFCHTGETNNLGGDLSITILYTHMYTHTYCLFYRYPTIIHTYIYIYTLFHHTKFSICFTAQIDHHHVYTYIVCFTTQS